MKFCLIALVTIALSVINAIASAIPVYDALCEGYEEAQEARELDSPERRNEVVYQLAENLSNMMGQSSSPKVPKDCYWDGTAPFCKPECDAGYHKEKEDNCGDGACCATGSKYLCCKDKY